MRSQVQLLLGPPVSCGETLFEDTDLVRGLSSVGRAPALQAGGQRFEPVRLHHFSNFPEMKTTVSAVNTADLADLPPFFDIVNGF